MSDNRIVRLTFIRHGKTSPMENGKSDADRELSSEGKEQVLSRKKRLAAAGIKDFDLVLCSPLHRTLQTARIIMGTNGQVPPLAKVAELAVDTYQHSDLLTKMWEEIGSQSGLSPFLHHQYGWALSYYSLWAWNKIGNLVRHSESSNVLVVGHGLLLPAIGHLAVGSLETKREFLTRPIREAEGFILVMEGVLLQTRDLTLHASEETA